MVYNELEQGDILSEVRVGLASIAYSDISLRSIWGIFKIRQTPVRTLPKRLQTSYDTVVYGSGFPNMNYKLGTRLQSAYRIPSRQVTILLSYCPPIQ